MDDDDEDNVDDNGVLAKGMEERYEGDAAYEPEKEQTNTRKDIGVHAD